MIWLLVIGLALVGFLAAVLAFRLERNGWSAFAAALALGLAGYALQASPNVPGSPGAPLPPDEELGWALIDARQAMVDEDDRSRSPRLLSADAYARNGRYADASVLLRGAVADDPRDGEAWLALGNALVEHADGTLTPPAIYAFRRAAAIDPHGAGAGYFLGLALLRENRAEEARSIWRDTLEAAAPDAAGRAQLETVLARLETALGEAQAAAAAAPQTAAEPAAPAR